MTEGDAPIRWDDPSLPLGPFVWAEGDKVWRGRVRDAAFADLGRVEVAGDGEGPDADCLATACRLLPRIMDLAQSCIDRAVGGQVIHDSSDGLRVPLQVEAGATPDLVGLEIRDRAAPGRAWLYLTPVLDRDPHLYAYVLMEAILAEDHIAAISARSW